MGHPARVRLAATLTPATFHQAELSALRLDGDSYRLGEVDVLVDEPLHPALRAATLAPAAERHDLVAAGWTAAWIHGAWPALRRPLTLCIDLSAARRTRMLAEAPREVRFRPGDVARLDGVRVTTPLRTALDLARLEEAFIGAPVEAAIALLERAQLTPDDAATLVFTGPRTPYKRRCVDRLRALAA